MIKRWRLQDMTKGWNRWREYHEMLLHARALAKKSLMRWLKGCMVRGRME